MTLMHTTIEVKHRITAEEALELADYESELDLIDKGIEQAADEGKRSIQLDKYFRISQNWRDEIVYNLRGRGFEVQQKHNPTLTTVSW